MTHLRCYEQESLLDVWADTRIKTGQDWKREIALALDRASVAILLISADFLASEFIRNNELPPLLEAARTDGVKIMPVILGHCGYESMPHLKKFQAINSPSKPVSSMSVTARDKLWAQLAKSIADELPLPTEEFASPSALLETEIYGDVRDFLSLELDNPQRVQKYLVYSYEHVDYMDFMPLAKDALQVPPEILENIQRRLLKAGWEGDGEIRVLWLPPFAGVGVEDTFGHILWHVKQGNNGTSWIASSLPLRFPSLSGPL